MAEQTFRSPGFFEQEIDLTERVTRATGIPAGVVGTALKGPAFVPLIVGSFADFQNRFGTLDPNLFGPYAVREFLKHRNALTYLRVLGAGANSTSADILTTRNQGTVKSAGFVVTGTRNDADYTGDRRYSGITTFLCAQHVLSATNGELQGFPVFSDNDSFSERAGGEPADLINLVRGVLMFPTGTRAMIANGNQFLESTTNFSTFDDLAGAFSDGLGNNNFKFIISSSAGTGFANDDGIAGLRIMSASLDPASTNYIAKIMNTDPWKFQEKQHLLYAHFAVEKELAAVLTENTGSVGLLSGSDTTDTSSGDPALKYSVMYGKFDTRYTSPRTTTFISQPYGSAEYDLFHFETLSDGQWGNDQYKISIVGLRASTDPADPYGTFEVQVRLISDLDTDTEVLERFPNCSLDPNSSRYVARQVGDKKVSFNWDADQIQERRLVISGKYPNRSKYIRIVIQDSVENSMVPGSSLPFGFRGVPTVKTTDSLTDGSGRTLYQGATQLGSLAGTRRLAATGSVTEASSNVLTGSVVPPLPYRFKVTQGAVDGTSPAYIGAPGADERVNSNFYWGVKTTRLPHTGTVALVETADAVLKANSGQEFNPLIRAYGRFMGIQKLDGLVTGSGADAFNNNKFTLARVALGGKTKNQVAYSFTDVSGTARQHMLGAAYIRNAAPDGVTYLVYDSSLSKNRATLATLLQSSSVTFNRFTEFAKFTNVFYGGFDGLNILDKDCHLMNDRASSTDPGGKGSATAVGSFGLGLANTDSTSFSMMGNGIDNNSIAAYRQAVNLMTDKMVINTNILAVPGIRDSFVTDYAAIRTKEYSLAMYLMDMIPYDENKNRLFSDGADGWVTVRGATLSKPTEPDVREISEKFDSRALDNNYSATYFPDVYIQDPINNRPVRNPASVAALGALGFNDQVSYPWFAPAGFNRGALESVTNVDVRLNSGDRDTLYDARINPIATFPDGGFVIFGQKTLQQAKSALDRVNVRRMLLEVKRLIVGIANKLIFEQNNATTRARFVAQVTPLLSLIQAQAGVEQFSIVCDDTNNTTLDVEQNRMNGRIVVVPTRAVEFISIDFIVTNSGVSFE
tara:strand:- start:3053 stop:6301 length:3249 start_codon:yes stop_codon:yes gene_type:complete